MNHQFVWAVKSQLVRQSAKKLSELAQSEDLFDVSSLDKNSYEYKQTQKSFEEARKIGCHIITYIDSDYPEKLKNISQPPPVLYVLGNKKLLSKTVFAGMVGARRCDDYGIRTAENIAMEIGQTGAGIISGGAIGVDAASHRGALRAKAPTVAVLGSGIDVAYPPENHTLFSQIIKNNGALVSEFHFGEAPNAKNFPRRNRIIAALSSALIVVRAARKSGSLITATQAMDMSVPVFSVPGNIDNKLSIGTNELILDGAVPLLNAMDVVDELIAKNPDFFVREKSEQEAEDFNLQTAWEKETENEKIFYEGLSEYETEIVNIISGGADTISLIEEKISFEPSRLTALLQMMEIKGIIKKGITKKYVLNIK